jgi:Bacterial Ig domain
MTMTTRAHRSALLFPALLTSLLASSLVACSEESESPDNHAPVLPSGRGIITDEDVPVVVNLVQGVRDADGDPVTLVAFRAINASYKRVGVDSVEVTPPENSTEQISLVYTVSDGKASVEGAYAVTVRPVNDAPVAHSGAFRLRGALSFLLSARDIENDPLTYEIVEQPAHGTVTGTPPNIIYTAEAGYAGADRVVYRVNDGSFSSPTATVDFDVHLGARPVALPQNAAVTEDVSQPLTLASTDADGDPRTYTITSPPAHGALTGTPPLLTYVPEANYNGADSFAFTVHDGYQTSLPATVQLAVSSVNDAPTATPLSASVNEDGTVQLTFDGSDVDGPSSLSYYIETPPAHGSVTGLSQLRTYRPTPNYHGADSFTYRAFDGTSYSPLVTVSLAVAPMPDLPTAGNGSKSFDEDTATSVVLSGFDADGDALTFAVVTPPARGTLAGTPPTLQYTPPPNYFGTQTLTYSVSANGDSATGTVTLNVLSRNDAPVAEDLAVDMVEDTSKAITLLASDVDSTSLNYIITSSPIDGTLTQVGGAVFTYTPAPNANGTRTFSFRARDNFGAEDYAVVTLSIAAVNDAPVAASDSVVVAAAQPVTIALLDNDSDPEGDPISVEGVSQPANGTIALDEDTLVYTPSQGFTGVETLTYTVADAHGAESTAAVHVGIGAIPPGLPQESVAISGGNPGGDFGRLPSISDDGRVIAFASRLALVPEDTNGLLDIYVYHRVTRQLTRVSTAPDGGQLNADSHSPHVAGGGRYLVYASSASTIVPGDSNGRLDVFRRDLLTHQTLRVSVSSSGAQGSNSSGLPKISDDGNIVVFSSSAFELVPDDVNGVSDVFVRDIAASSTSRVSISSAGNAGDGGSSQPELSGDGRFIVFWSTASNLVAGDNNGHRDVFFHDRSDGATTRISISSTGAEGDDESHSPSVSDDGRFISFLSIATNFGSPPTTGSSHAYVRDRQAQTTTRTAGYAVTHTTLSDDGRYLTEYLPSGSVATALIRDRFASLFTNLVRQGSGHLVYPVISGNGRYIVVLDNNNGAVIVTPNPH